MSLSTPEADYYRLRTEWLRFKSHLFDSITGLPALPAVIEDVRRLVESRGPSEVVYLDLGRSGWHETKLGWAAYDEAVREFAGLLLAMKSAGELGLQDILCLHTVRSDRFLIFSNGSAASGERTPRALRDRLAGLPSTSLLGSLRIAVGRVEIRKDPMVRSERAIQQAVADAMLMSLAEKEGGEAVRREALARMIGDASVRSVFHPIVRLADCEQMGHVECFGRTRPRL